MLDLTQSLAEWMFRNHREILPLVMLGHAELVTEDMYKDYIEWVKTEEGSQYLKGGSKYREEE